MGDVDYDDISVPRYNLIDLRSELISDPFMAFQAPWFNAAANAPMKQFSMSDVPLSAEHVGSIPHIHGWTFRKKHRCTPRSTPNTGHDAIDLSSTIAVLARAQASVRK